MEDGIEILDTGSQGLEGIVEDLEVIGVLEVGIEELEVMTEELKTGIEDLGELEAWVWVDWSLDGLTSGFDLVAALLGELPVSLVSSMSPPSSFTSPPWGERVGIPGEHMLCGSLPAPLPLQ